MNKLYYSIGFHCVNIILQNLGLRQILSKLTDDDLPVFLVVCDLVSGPGLWECESSHDEDDQPRHILPVRLSSLILVPVAVAVAETETINFYQTFSLDLI